MSRCWTCRRRRLKCDGAIPSCRKCLDNGAECLGYVKPLTWVEGVNIRGPRKNQTFGKSRSLGAASHALASVSGDGVSRSPEADLCCNDWLSSSGSSPQESSESTGASCQSSPAMDLTLHQESRYAPLPMATLSEPLFKDLDLASRFFIDYFLVLQDTGDNRYRGLIPLIASCPPVAGAIITLASCHFTHSLMDAPVLSLHAGSAKSLPSAENVATVLSNPLGVRLSTTALVNHYLRSKAKCLASLAAALADATQRHCHSTLATILLLTILEGFESGAGSWTVHLEGAKRFLVDEPRGRKRADAHPPFLTNDISMFQALGSTITRPGLLSSSFPAQAAQLMSTDSLVTMLGCPSSVQSAIGFFSSQRRLNAATELPVDVAGLKDALLQVHTFDVEAWATSVAAHGGYASMLEALRRLGTIWKLGAKIYACRILSNVRQDPAVPMPSVEYLFAEYPCPETDDDDVIKSLIWPTFIAGAACSRVEHRDWALRVLDRIWHIAFCANAKSAAVVLANLWRKQDLRDQGHDWDWLAELSSLEDSWLFI